MKGKTKQRVMAVILTLVMAVSLLPLELLGGGVVQVKAADNGAELTDGDFAGWSWAAFGSGTNTANNKVTTTSDGSGKATLETTGDKGKIANANDGINFLYKQVNETDDFILSATATVNEWSGNPQACFGLMARAAVGTSTSEAKNASGNLVSVFTGSVKGTMGGLNRSNGDYTLDFFSYLDGYSGSNQDKYNFVTSDNSALVPGMAAGNSYNLILQKSGSTIYLYCNGALVTTSIVDADYDGVMYVGPFVSRNCTVVYSNVSLQVKAADETVALVNQVSPAKTQYTAGNTVADIDLTGFSAEVTVGSETRTITGNDCRIKSFAAENAGDSSIVLDYLGLDITIPITVIVEEITDMTMSYAPTKTEYFLGDNIDWTGFAATVTYNSGVTKDVKALIENGDSETTVSGFDNTAAGTQTVTVAHTHGGVTKSVSFDVNVSGAVLDSITLTGPTKTTYYKDVAPETDDYKKGLRIVANYSDGTTDIITNMSASGVSITPNTDVDTSAVGTTTYTVNYTVGNQTKSATYDLTVVEGEVTDLTIKSYPATTTYAKGTDFSTDGLVVATVSNSGVETELTAAEYTVDSSAFNKDAIGTYTITVTENVSGKNFSVSYTVTVEEKTQYGYNDLEWKAVVFGQSCDKSTTPSYDAAAGTITVEQKEGKGKVTDAGQDGIAYYYTTVPADKNFVLTADVTVDYFVTKSAPDNQEGFGIMVRDAINTHGDSSIFYSDAATVGGYYGRYNVFGRYGITALQTEEFTNFYLYSKTNSATSWYKVNNQVNAFVISSPTKFKMTLGKDNTGIWATMVDENGNDVLDPNTYHGVDGINVSTTDTEPYRVYLPADAFTSVDPDKIYVGFMAARGAKIEVDASSIAMTITSAASDAPQKVLPAEPVVPAVSVTSLSTSSDSNYTLKVNVNTLGLLTVKVNGQTVKKQMDVTTAGTVEIPLTLVKGNNTVQLTFEPDPSQNITNSNTIISNNTITYKTYGAASDVIYVAPDGTKNGDGTKENPLDIVTAINFCQAGQTIYALGGTYSFKSTLEIPHGNNGTADAMKELVAAPDNTEDVVFDFNSTSSTFNVSGDYWHVKGISVTKATGMRIGGSHNLIELCKAYKNTDTGIQISRTDNANTIDEWPSYNTILNCDSYANRDSSDNNADGFAAKLTSGVGNEFRGCVAYFNADDGWDLFAKASAIGSVKLYDCISYANGFGLDDSGNVVMTKGDGNGFKLGGSGVSVAHEIHNSIAFGNKSNGYTNNSNPLFNAYDCIGYNNGGDNLELHFYTGVSTAGALVQNFVSFADASINDFSLLADASTGSDYSGVASAANFLYNEKTGKSTNTEGLEITADNFASVSEFVGYCNNELHFTRDENGNIIYGDFLKYTAPTPAKLDIVPVGVQVKVPDGVVLKDSDGNVISSGTVYLAAEDDANLIKLVIEEITQALDKCNIKFAEGSEVKYYDVNLVDSHGEKVTFEGGKLTIIFNYPEGTGMNGYEFKVYHGLSDEKVEQLTPTLTKDGIQVEVSSLSPFAIEYKAVTAGTGPETDDEDDYEEGTPVESVKTGDTTPIAPLLAIIFVSAGICGAYVFRKKKSF